MATNNKQFKNKTEWYRDHFKKRMLERFGLTINRNDIREITNWILNGDNVLSEEKKSSRVTKYRVIFKQNDCFVLFDHVRNVPMTTYSAKNKSDIDDDI